MPKANRPPSYRLHKPRGCGVVTIEGHNHYLGPYGSPEKKSTAATNDVGHSRIEPEKSSIAVLSSRLDETEGPSSFPTVGFFSFGANALRQIASSAEPVQMANQTRPRGGLFDRNSFSEKWLRSSNPAASFPATGKCQRALARRRPVERRCVTDAAWGRVVASYPGVSAVSASGRFAEQLMSSGFSS